MINGKEAGKLNHRTYELQGMILKIPIYFDEHVQKWIEDYQTFIEMRVFTPMGHPIMFAGEDACPRAEDATPGGCPDCGSCRFYRRIAKHSWLGWCAYRPE